MVDPNNLMSVRIGDLYRAFIHPVDCLQTSSPSTGPMGVWTREWSSNDATSSM